MGEAGIRAKTKWKFKATMDSKHSYPIASNLLGRNFQVEGRNQVWLTDITYIRTKEGWLCLDGIMDLGSRRIEGWSMADRMTKEFVSRALKMGGDGVGRCGD